MTKVDRWKQKLTIEDKPRVLPVNLHDSDIVQAVSSFIPGKFSETEFNTHALWNLNNISNLKKLGYHTSPSQGKRAVSTSVLESGSDKKLPPLPPLPPSKKEARHTRPPISKRYMECYQKQVDSSDWEASTTQITEDFSVKAGVQRYKRDYSDIADRNLQYDSSSDISESIVSLDRYANFDPEVSSEDFSCTTNLSNLSSCELETDYDVASLVDSLFGDDSSIALDSFKPINTDGPVLVSSNITLDHSKCNSNLKNFVPKNEISTGLFKRLQKELPLIPSHSEPTANNSKTRVSRGIPEKHQEKNTIYETHTHPQDQMKLDIKKIPFNFCLDPGRDYCDSRYKVKTPGMRRIQRSTTFPEYFHSMFSFNDNLYSRSNAIEKK